MSKEEGLVAVHALLQDPKFNQTSAESMVLFIEEFKELKLKYGVTRVDLWSEYFKLHPIWPIESSNMHHTFSE